MHQAFGADDLAAEGLPDRLMPEADAEHGHARSGDRSERDPGVGRGTRAWRDEHAGACGSDLTRIKVN